MTADLPGLPPFVTLVARPLPLGPLSLVLSALTGRIATAHPSLLGRLGQAADRRFLLDVVDLPFVLLLRPARRQLIAARRRKRLPLHDATIRGPLAGFLAMLHGAEDGDALFFSRDLTIAGDTEAVLALRNALDDAEIDLTEEISGLAGPLAGASRAFLNTIERYSGLSLHRVALTEHPG